MAIDIKLPNIASPTEKGQIEQIKSYLYQLADTLKWAFNTIEGGSNDVVVNKGSQNVQSKGKESTTNDAESTFNSVKALIIKSADIVNAYYEVISNKLVGEYVAQSDFGTYSENTEKEIRETSSATEELYKNIQKITSDLDGLKTKLIEVNAHIKSGLLFYDGDGVPIYGLEVGQINEINGVEVFNKYARFTSDRLSFYDKNDIEVAYISDYRLHITNAEITGTLTLGRFVFEPIDGLAIKWV
jgi:hypothetical protein